MDYTNIFDILWDFIEKMVSFGAINVVKVENGTASEPSCGKRREQTRLSIFKTINTNFIDN